MEPFQQIFPKSLDPIKTLTLTRRSGTIPKGTYGFIECYCTEPGCDCRRVMVLVLNEKMKQKGVICLGFDQDGPMDGPFLEPSASKVAYAGELLEYFVKTLNADPGWLDLIYRQYRAVRELVDGGPYRGKPLPKPGKFHYRVTPPPDLEALLERSLQELSTLEAASPAPKGRKRGGAGTSPEGASPARNPLPARPKGMARLVKRYAKSGAGRSVADHTLLQEELRRYLQDHELAGEELAALLPALCQRSPEDDEQIDAALRLLFDMLDTLRIDLERSRPASRQRMERLQSALAARVFLENEDLDLCVAVSRVLLQSRVEILPVLREANSQMLRAGAGRADLREEPGEEMLAGIARSLQSMGLSSPFEGVEALLQLFALNEPDMQTALIAEMLDAEDPFLREISALMLFHPDPQVRLGVAQLLAARDGASITSPTLRRLIVSRNWFPEEIRTCVDQAVHNARRARVDCAPLPRPPVVAVHASTVDGAGAQSFQVIVPNGKGFFSCSILLKQGGGVADAFVVPLASKRELGDFLAMLKQEASFIETSSDHLDLRVSQALADGVATGKAPSYWLVRITELLGCDRWQAAPFDARRELARLREHLASLGAKLLDRREYCSALEESAAWQGSEPMLSSWFEDDDAVDQEIEASRGRRKAIDAGAAIDRIQGVVLEKRRAVWLERLVLTTLWLKSSKKAPVPWYRMFHVAQAVADRSLPLREIPLMFSIAQLSYKAYLGRKKSAARQTGAGG